MVYISTGSGLSSSACTAMSGPPPLDYATWSTVMAINWQRGLANKLAPATVNNHLASLAGFTTWVSAQEPGLFTTGNPSTGVLALPLPPLEPRSLTPAQVRSLKNLCDRLERYSQRKGRRRGRGGPLKRHGHSRPVRDRAIVFLLLSTGLRRLELVLLDLDQVQPAQPARLRAARRARIVGVRGKGGLWNIWTKCNGFRVFVGVGVGWWMGVSAAVRCWVAGPV